MSLILSPAAKNLKAFAFESFVGIDTSRDATAQDFGSNQPLRSCNNAYCDWRGLITRDPGVERRGANNGKISRLQHVGRDLLCWAQIDGGGITLRSDRTEHYAIEVFTPGTVVSSTVYNGKACFFGRGQRFYTYDGLVFRDNRGVNASFGTAIQTRLAVAGIPGYETEVHLCRSNDENFWPLDEEAGETSVLRAGLIDIRNLIGSGESITGLGTFETDNLCIFTEDRTLVYRLNESMDDWAIDDRANIDVGTVSHNSICRAGPYMLFCARDGVHALQRSTDNGIILFTSMMSRNVQLLYRQLLASVTDPTEINAVYDPDEGQYHVFFPQPGGILATRLTLTINPDPNRPSHWSTGDYINARCGAFLGGQLVYGTSGGLYEVLHMEEESEFTPQFTLTTPILWHGQINAQKTTHSLLLQADGTGEIIIEAFDEHGTPIYDHQVTVDEEAEDDNFPDVPLTRQYELFFQRRYRGVQFRFTSLGTGKLRITGFAVLVDQQR